MLALATILGGLSHWKIYEYDLFWNIRAGLEILGTGQVQRIDTWSFTVPGRDALNFEWLATVTEALVWKAGGGYAALATLRSLLVGGWLLMLGLLIRRVSRREGSAALAALVLLPWVYLCSHFRLQMRPDLFATVHYAALLLAWTSPLELRRKILLGTALLFSWANFHTGTVLIGIFVQCGFLLFGTGQPSLRTRWRERLAGAAAAGTMLLATPFHVEIIRLLIEGPLSYDHARVQNPDFQPFTFELLRFSHGGWSLLLWVLYLPLWLGGYVWLHRHERARLPAPYRAWRLVALVGGVLTAGTFNKIRLIHYESAFVLPIAAAFCAAQFERRGFTRPSVPIVAAALALALLWGVALPEQVRFVARPLGAGVMESDIPVHAVEFIRRVRPAKNLLNAYEFGGYLVKELPDYPVALDGRGLPFQSFMDEMAAAQKDPALFAGFLDRYRVQASLERIPGMAYDEEARRFVDQQEAYYPRSRWALVYFDDVSVLYLRRIPEHARAIEEHEYRHLRRGSPATYGALMKGVRPEDRAAIEAEVDRCLRELPTNEYCATAKSAYLRERGDPLAALGVLLRAGARESRGAELLVELGEVYAAIGLRAEARDAQRRFKRVTSAL
jgi:hypothetical protein